MAIPSENASQILKSYQTSLFKNLFAQSDARSVLYEVGEITDNFPQFSSELTNQVTLSAYAILAAGVSLAENGQRDEAIPALEEAATLLNNTHRHQVSESGFHILIAAMAFYAAGQYSKAFVAIKHVEPQTDLAGIVAAFLKKQPNEVISRANPYLLANLEQFDDYDNICEHAVTVAVSRALSLFLEYLATSKQPYVTAAQNVIETALSITVEYQSPALWWIIRLLKLMIADGYNASLWNQLPPHFSSDTTLLDKYIRLLLFGKHPVMELWHSQRQAIPIVLDQTKHGAIVNMRTSAGKTRVAELAMLQTLHNDDSAKILYLAPFRSLAFEMEQTLSQTFDRLGFHVSHLYGGFRVSTVDRQLSQESSIIIATPEKAKAILRGSPELFKDIKLIVVDEGHLIGANERYVKNELFLDHLRFITNSLNCKIIMLSAVLPNPEHLATWLTGDSNNVAKSDWKPSSERFGLLRWRRNHVRIDWLGEVESFNPKFIESRPLGWGRRRNPFPNNKNEAVAATAVRLTNVGPVMIFSARANSIAGLAKSVLVALGESPNEHPWPKTIWKVFEATAKEELPEDAIELKAAKYGVICHSDNLPPQVRLATERLMRSHPPKIIIASTTLGQGVNIGISSVIIATPYYGKNPINHRDFWNICGRAGRAFVDGEGKILYAIDETEERKKINKHEEFARNYFNPSNSNAVESGILYVINLIFNIAQRAEVNFEKLLGMIAENDFSGIGEKSGLCNYIIDLMDDGLLAFQEDTLVNPKQLPPEEWVDDVFRESLASIQVASPAISISQEQLFQVIKTRLDAILKIHPDQSQRRAYVSTGLPLSSAKNLYRDRETFVQQAKKLINSNCSPQSVIVFLTWLEEWSRTNAKAVVEEFPESKTLDLIRESWVMAVPMREIIQVFNEADSICKNVYGYRIPWLIHAVSQLLRASGNEDEAEVLGNVGMIVELGVPTVPSAMIFLAGVRSRVAATEISQTNIELGTSVSQVKKSLRDTATVKLLRQQVSDSTAAWIDIHTEMSKHEKESPPDFNPFTLPQLNEHVENIIVRKHEDITYLCSPDGVNRVPVQSTKSSLFDQITNEYRFSFQRDGDVFKLFVRDPQEEVNGDQLPDK